MKMLKRTTDIQEPTPTPATSRVESLKAASAALRRPASLQVAAQTLRAARDRHEECHNRLIAAIRRNEALPDPQKDNLGREIMALEVEARASDRAIDAAALTLAAERTKWEPTFRAFILHFQAEAGRDMVTALDIIDAALPVLRAAEDQLVRNGMQPTRRLIAPNLEYLREIAEKFAGAAQ